MASSSQQAKCLCESEVCAASQQYDASLIFHASLTRRGLCQIAPTAFARCQSLQLLDISGNRLATLSGLAPIAAQLTFLNAADNKLTDISVLAQSSALQYCYLEGNELASVEALKPLLTLPNLSELVLQRTIVLAGVGDPQETLLLDNPVCRNVEDFRKGFLSNAGHIRWVDGALAFTRQRLHGAGNPAGKLESEVETLSNEVLLSSAAAAHASAFQEMTRNNAEENALKKLLADAAKKCAQAAQ